MITKINKLKFSACTVAYDYECDYQLRINNIHLTDRCTHYATCADTGYISQYSRLCPSESCWRDDWSERNEHIIHLCRLTRLPLSAATLLMLHAIFVRLALCRLPPMLYKCGLLSCRDNSDIMFFFYCCCNTAHGLQPERIIFHLTGFGKFQLFI